MNSPLPFQSPGATLLEIQGPWEKNDLIAGTIGGTPSTLRGTDPLGFAQDTITSWLTGTPLGATPSGDSPVPSAPETSMSQTATRIGVGVLAIVLIGLGVYWVMKA